MVSLPTKKIETGGRKKLLWCGGKNTGVRVVEREGGERELKRKKIDVMRK